MYKKLSLVALTAVAVACSPAGPARGDALDQRFLDTLSAQGINANRTSLIAFGLAGCEVHDHARMVNLVGQIEAIGLTAPQAVTVLTEGVKTYCPNLAKPE